MDHFSDIIFTSTVVSAFMAVITFILFKLQQKGKYEETLHKIALDDIRHSLEKQIYNLNDRLVKNEERWREANHLLLTTNTSESFYSKKNIYYSNFLKSNGITENDLIVQNNLIFVLTPFHDKYYKDYKVIRDVCTDLGFVCIRGDESRIMGDIFPEMLKLIAKANIVIANINGRNPNVLYELGIAQALDKNVILISEEPEALKLPANIKSKQFLFYSTYEQLEKMLKMELYNIIEVNKVL